MRPPESEYRQRRCNESTRILAGQGWSLGEVIDRLFGSVFGAAAADPYEAGINRAVEWVEVMRTT